MRKILIATAAAAGLMALGACQPATTEDETDMAATAEDGGAEASVEGGAVADSSGSGGASAAGDSGSDASSGGSMAAGDSASAPLPVGATDPSTDPMVTGQGSTGAEGRIQMPSEPAHPARQ